MAYEYDVFISYRRDSLPRRWMEETFLPLFESHLREALGGREIRVYRDIDSNLSGQDWKNNICRALAYSKCLVPILLPSYFHSEWCIREFSIIYDRQSKCGFNTLDNPNGLIVPLKIRDGIHFPDQIKRIQTLDCNEFYRVGKGFESTQKFIQFQEVLSEWVDQVAGAVNRAPEWSEEWLSEHYLTFTNAAFDNSGPIKMKPPTL